MLVLGAEINKHTSEGTTPAMPAATSSASRLVCVKTIVLPALAYTVNRSAKMFRLVLGMTCVAKTLQSMSKGQDC